MLQIQNHMQEKVKQQKHSVALLKFLVTLLSTLLRVRSTFMLFVWICKDFQPYLSLLNALTRQTMSQKRYGTIINHADHEERYMQIYTLL